MIVVAIDGVRRVWRRRRGDRDHGGGRCLSQIEYLGEGMLSGWPDRLEVAYRRQKTTGMG